MLSSAVFSFWIKIVFIEEQENDIDDVIFSWTNVDWASMSNRRKVACWTFLNSIECSIDFVRHMSEILFFSVILILHWKDQIEWLLSQLTHFLLFIETLHVESLCDFAQIEHRLSCLQILSIWSYRWQLKHCLILQLLTNNSHEICEYSCKKSSLIKRFVCFALCVFTIKDDSFFSSLIALFDQTTLAMRKFECKISFYLSIRWMIFCWLIVCTSITRTSWISISNVLNVAYVDEVTCFINELLIIRRFLAFSERVMIFTFSLKRRLVVITSFFIFSTFCRRFISFLTKSVRKLFFFFCFFILKINVFFLLIFSSCLCWLMLLYDAMIIVVVVSTLRWLFVFVAIAYEIRMMIIFAVLRSMLFSLMFIFFNVSVICFFTINVDNKTSTRWRRDSDVETSISSINLLRSKLLISFVRCFLRLFKENFFKIVRILVRTSRRLMNDDITSIRAENLFWFIH